MVPNKHFTCLGLKVLQNFFCGRHLLWEASWHFWNCARCLYGTRWNSSIFLFVRVNRGSNYMRRDKWNGIHYQRWITRLMDRWRAQPAALLNANCRHIEHRKPERTLRHWDSRPNATSVWGLHWIQSSNAFGASDFVIGVSASAVIEWQMFSWKCFAMNVVKV